MAIEFEPVRASVTSVEHLADTVNRNLDQLRQLVSVLGAVPFLDGVLLEDVEITASGSNPIAHGLGRPFRGFFVVGGHTDNDIALQASQDDPAIFININCDATQTVNLWVF